MKKCSKCLKAKLLNDFGKRAVNKDGLSGWCSECQRNYTNERRKTQSKWWREQSLKRYYSLSMEIFERMLGNQKGLCNICGVKMTNGGKGKRSLNVDHCHNTGKVRGLLCKMCNVMLGLSDDNAEILEKAAAYLRLHSK